ncbi:MAG TPA: hypothetical protein VGI39_01510 [Polyangiaceae bacterium]|jgi:hypothetical protein
MTHPKEGEWWCPGAWRGVGESGTNYAGCDGDASCKVCGGRSLAAVLEARVDHESWADRKLNDWQGRMLRGWANLMASRYGRPVFLCGGALKDATPRDIDVRVVLLASEFEARFGPWRSAERVLTDVDEMDADRRWHVEIAKMNVQGANHTHLPVDFQVQALPTAMRYLNERRRRLDDVPGLVPPWET